MEGYVWAGVDDHVGLKLERVFPLKWCNVQKKTESSMFGDLGNKMFTHLYEPILYFLWNALVFLFKTDLNLFIIIDS